jgi:hypothetical protein
MLAGMLGTFLAWAKGKQKNDAHADSQSDIPSDAIAAAYG